MLGSLSNVATSVDNIEYQYLLSGDQNSLRNAEMSFHSSQILKIFLEEYQYAHRRLAMLCLVPITPFDHS